MVILVPNYASCNRLETRSLTSRLSPFSCELKASISFVEDLLLPAFEAVERRDVSDGTVQPHGVVLRDIASDESSCIFERRWSARADAIAFDRAMKSFDFPFDCG
jgi:hypothetical protein